MTKKMFQISRILMVVLTIGVCLTLLLDGRVMILDKHIYLRCMLEFASLTLFLIISRLYEAKRKIFSTGYLFLMINAFINGTICPCYYTDSRLLRDERDNYYMPNDHFMIYMKVYFILMSIILVYLLCLKHTTNEIKRYDFIEYKDTDDFAILAGSVLLALPVMEMTGTSGVMLMTPVLCYFFGRLMYSKFSLSQSIFCFIGLLLGIYGIYRILDQRYLVIQYAMPVILVFLVFVAVNDDRRKGKKVVPLMILGIIAVLLYGMLSEIVKLNRYWNGNYNLLYELTNFQSYIDFGANQFYRIFGIWTELGGNIIDFVHKNGFFYGITYVKFLAPYFGFEYVSLPAISARYIQASYAQPGLIAEGYANFGIIGSVVNMLIPFLLAEYFLNLFLKKRDGLSICLMTIPFVKILLDGGTINSIIVGIGICILPFSIYLLLKISNINVKTVENIRIRVFRKKKRQLQGRKSNGENNSNRSSI